MSYGSRMIARILKKAGDEEVADLLVRLCANVSDDGPGRDQVGAVAGWAVIAARTRQRTYRWTPVPCGASGVP